jgi:tRNA(His) guanylyltransferase
VKFDELDAQMRIFETAGDRCVVPDVYMVARIDGRNFTRLTKAAHSFAAPFDDRFRDLMVQTVEHLMTCGFRIIYGYTQSDEISLLFHRDDSSFNRKIRKLTSVLAGEASGKFSLLLGSLGTFDCRICELPNVERVRDYFRWRNEDAHRNALNAYCYWKLREQGKTVSEATNHLLKMTVAEKNGLLFQLGINFNDLPKWQKRGIGLYWEQYEHQGVDPRTNTITLASRRRIARDFELPMGDAYSEFVVNLVLREHNGDQSK